MNLSALLTCVDGEPAFALVRDLAAAGTGAVVEATPPVHPLVIAHVVAHGFEIGRHVKIRLNFGVGFVFGSQAGGTFSG